MKAYDKAWLDAIMYTINNQRCTGALWNITDKLNHNLSAYIRTTLGNTRTIHIHNSIRQGGLLAITQYATLMDKINKEIEQPKTNQNSDINLSYMTYLPLDHHIIKIVLFQIMVNILYIFLISKIF